MANQSSKTLGAIIGVAAAAVAGFATGILTAPKSGDQTRADIKKNVVKRKKEVLKSVDKAVLKAEDVVEEVAAKAKDVKARAEQAVAGAKKGAATNPEGKKK